MAILINFFDNVILQAISEEIVPKVSFFKDRYCRIDKGHCIGDDYGCECNHRHAKQSVFYGA